MVGSRRKGLVSLKAWNSGTGYKSNCEVCSKEIRAEPSKKRRFCSRDCNHIWFRKTYSGDKFKGKNNPNYGNGESLKRAWKEGKFDNRPPLKSFNKGKWTWYKDTHFRSSWEAEFAKELDGLGIEWQYEKQQFKLSNGKRYTPDFYVPVLDKYYEVKGYWWPKSKAKFDLFKKEYPEIDIEVKGIEWWNNRNV